MALTSTISSSMIAVSSILSFDVYKTYINPKASDKRLVHVSHITVVFHAVFITAVSLALNYGGADMTWIGYFRPILSCPGIIPLAFTLCWSGQTKLAAILSPILGFLTGLAVWLGTAKSLYGEINLLTTEESLPALYGAIGSLFSPALYSVLISLYKPHKFDWREFLRIELADEAQLQKSSSIVDENSGSDEKSSTPSLQGAQGVIGAPVPGTKTSDVEKEAAKSSEKTQAHVRANPEVFHKASLDEIRHPFDDETLRELRRWYRIAWASFVAIVLVTFILWPMPLYRNYIFTRTFFMSWTTVAIIWQFFAFFAVAVYPLYDGRYDILKGTKGVYNAIRQFIVSRTSNK
jgi:urea-proton symporter